ncbi:hypothetical protein CHCC12620_2547 [Bacillus paralicheniformis]|nr:hypothetical protein CHCC12620_2547 [Bacillus paralicheniformis]
MLILLPEQQEYEKASRKRLAFRLLTKYRRAGLTTNARVSRHAESKPQKACFFISADG